MQLCPEGHRGGKTHMSLSTMDTKGPKRKGKDRILKRCIKLVIEQLKMNEKE